MIDASDLRAAAQESRLWNCVRAGAERFDQAVLTWRERSADSERRDRVVEQLIAGSLAGRASAAVLSAFGRAWPESQLRRVALRVEAMGGFSATRDGLLALATVTIAACATALVLRLLSTRPEPLTWLVPTAVIVAAVAALAVARSGADGNL